MKLGNKIFSIIFSFYFIFDFLIADEKITTAPLINVEKIKPSFEELDDDSENTPSKLILKEKNIKNLKPSQAVLIGLDKILQNHQN